MLRGVQEKKKEWSLRRNVGLAEASIELTSKRDRHAYLAGKIFIPKDADKAPVGFPDMIMSAALGCAAAAAV